jgi:hypothetical protein
MTEVPMCNWETTIWQRAMLSDQVHTVFFVDEYIVLVLWPLVLVKTTDVFLITDRGTNWLSQVLSNIVVLRSSETFASSSNITGET